MANEKTEIELNEPVDNSTEINNDESVIIDDKSTVISVENEHDDETDVSSEEIIENSLKQEDIAEIDKEAKEYMEKYSNEAEIDWDTIDFEDEGKNFPKITKEEVDVFCAVSQDFIDADVIETYINLARADIGNYLEMKELVESGQATEDDKNYYNDLSKSKESSRIMLAAIQQDGRKLSKEFKEARIAEDLIKAVTLKTCSDYIVQKYRFNHSWKNPDEKIPSIDNTDRIREALLTKMYISPLFYNIIERDSIKASTNVRFNMFGSKFYEEHLDDFVDAVRIYVKQGKLNFDKLTIEEILTSDFKTFEFMRLPMIWAIKSNDIGIKSISDWSYSSEEEEKITSRINPNNIFDNELKELSENISEAVNTLKQPKTLENGMKLAMDIINSDPLTKKIINVPDYDWNNSEQVMIDIAEFIPEDVTSGNFTEWANIFKYLQKYERYYLLYKLHNSVTDETVESDLKTVYTFNVLCGLVDDYYKFMVGELISAMDSFIKETGYRGETQNIMFSTIMSSFICQHELGYRQKLIIGGEDKNNSGEGLYKLAKEVLKDKYTYIVGSEKDDILLKNVDLIETRREYITNCTELVKFINSQLVEVTENVDEILSATKEVVTVRVSKKKKGKKK